MSLQLSVNPYDAPQASEGLGKVDLPWWTAPSPSLFGLGYYPAWPRGLARGSGKAGRLERHGRPS